MKETLKMMTKAEIFSEGVTWGLWAGYSKPEMMKLKKDQLILKFLMEMKKFDKPRF